MELPSKPKGRWERFKQLFNSDEEMVIHAGLWPESGLEIREEELEEMLTVARSLGTDAIRLGLADQA